MKKLSSVQKFVTTVVILIMTTLFATCSPLSHFSVPDEAVQYALKRSPLADS